MNRLLILFIVLVYSFESYADTTQNNVSGGNTSITGGYSASTTYESGSSSSSTTTNTSNSNIKSAPPAAYAPGFNGSGIDVCSTGVSGGLQTFTFGISGGKSVRDLNCERIKLARELKANGMAVAAVSLLCQDARVFAAMENAGTPCPYKGKIGKAATKEWKKYGKLRPDFEQYTKALKIIEEQEKKEAIKFEKEFNKAAGKSKSSK